MKHLINCLYKAAVKTILDDGVEHSGYMSFMVLLSVFPFLVFLLALTSFFGASELGQYFLQLLVENMPAYSADIIKNRMSELQKSPPQSLMTLAIVGSIWTASSFVECLRTILNRIYKVTTPPSYILRRLLSILQFLIISLLISFAMFLLVLIPIALSKIPEFVEAIESFKTMLVILRYSLILILLFLATSSLYYIIPNIKLQFSDVIPGAIVTVALWIMSGHLLSTYIVYYHQLNIVYGSLGSIIVTLIFFYIINMIFIYGAEFNSLLTEHKQAVLKQKLPS